MSQASRRKRSSLSALQAQARAGPGAAARGSSSSGAGRKNATGSNRSSRRDVKVASQGFQFTSQTARRQHQQQRQDQGQAESARDVEKEERELARERRRKEQRLEELERGSGPSTSWHAGDSNSVPAASTSAAAIAGLLAGRQAEKEGTFEDVAATPTNSTRKTKQSAELKRLLGQRRSLKLLLEDASASPFFRAAPNNFLQSLQVISPYPSHRSTGPVCSICGYWGDIRCMRCQERICGLKCAGLHNETRCERAL